MNDIFIRSILPYDLQALHSLYADKEARIMSGGKPSKTMDDTRLLLDKMVASGESYAIVLRKESKLIGVISLRHDFHRYNPKAYILGYQLSRQYWGQGIMTKAVRLVLRLAFENKGADIVCAGHFDTNIASKRVMEKCSMKFEGKLRHEFVRYDGEILDSNIHSILYEEYLQEKEKWASEQQI